MDLSPEAAHPDALYRLAGELGREPVRRALAAMVPAGRSTPHRYLTLAARMGSHDRADEAIREHVMHRPEAA